MRPGNTAHFKAMSHWWQAFDKTVFDLTGTGCELQIFRSKDERVTARPTGRFYHAFTLKFIYSSRYTALLFKIYYLLKTAQVKIFFPSCIK